MIRYVRLWSVAVVVAVGTASPLSASEPPATVAGDESRAADATLTIDRSVALQPPELTEGSGLAVSRRRAERFWIHNDSGDGPQLYAVDRSGRGTGRWQVQGAEAVDWEDMASVVLDGRPQLLIADVGDNAATRGSVSLYFVDEPDPDASGLATVTRRIDVTYPDGPRDCEAVAVDRAARQIVLVAKTAWLAAGVYGVSLDDTAPPVVARRLTQVTMPLVTAMDIRDRDGAIVLGGYFDAFVYRRAPGETVTAMLGGQPQHVALPRLRQIEGVCFDQQGQLWVCSEGRPGRLAQVAVADVTAGNASQPHAADAAPAVP